MRWKWQRRPRPADLGVHVVQLVAAADLHQQHPVEVLALEPPPGALQPAEHRRERGVGRGGLRHEQRCRVEVRVPDGPALAIAPAGPEKPRIPMQKPLRQRRQRRRHRRQHARGTRPQRAPRDGAAPRSLQPHLAGGHHVIKCQYLSKCARKQLWSYVSLSAFKLKSARTDIIAPG